MFNRTAFCKCGFQFIYTENIFMIRIECDLKKGNNL